MAANDLIKFCRILGDENVAQLQQFSRKLKPRPGNIDAPRMASAHLELKPEMYDEFVSVAERTVSEGKGSPLAESFSEFIDVFRASLEQSKKHFKELYAKGNKIVLDIKAANNGSDGAVKMHEVIRSAEGNVVSESKVMINAGEDAIRTQGSSNIANKYGGNIDVLVTKDARPNVGDIMPKVQYKVENGVAELSTSRIQGKGYDAQLEFKFPEEVLNEQTRIQSRGRFQTFGDALAELRK